MAGHVKIDVKGTQALKQAFRQLEPKLAKGVIHKAVRGGMKIVQAEAKINAPVRTGAGRRKIRVRTSKGPRGSKLRYTIALAVLVGEAMRDTWYMWLQEFGYHIGKRLRQAGKVVGYATTKTQPVVRKMVGRHYTRKAMRAKEASVKQYIVDEILAGIEREVRKRP